MPKFMISLAPGENPQEVADELEAVASAYVTIISVTHDSRGGNVIFECSEAVALEINKRIKPGSH